MWPTPEKHRDRDCPEMGVPVMPGDGTGKAPSGLPARGAGRGELRLARLGESGKGGARRKGKGKAPAPFALAMQG